MRAEEDQQDEDMKEETKKANVALESKRDHVPTRLEVYYHDLAYKPLPALNIRTHATVEGMKNGAPWLLAENDWGKSVKRSVIQTDTKETQDGFSLDVIGK